jgi:transitional endoplasmic reticulum ATPase
MNSYHRTSDRRLSILSHCGRNTQRRIRSYASRLLDARNLDASLLAFVICTLKPTAQHKLLKATEKGTDQKDEVGSLSMSADEIAQKLLLLTDRKASHVTHDWLIRELQNGLRSGIPADVAPPMGLKQLADMLALEKPHVDIVMFLYHCETYEPLSNLLSFYDSHGFMKLVSDANGLTHTAVIDAVKAKGRLNSTGLIDTTMPKHTPPIVLCDHVVAMVGGISTGYLTDKFFSKDSAPTLPIERTHVPSLAKNIISSLLTQPGPANILLYGIPGTGKTEFARSIVTALGQTTYQVKHPEDSDSRFLENRRVSLIATTNSIAPEKGVLIVDEADTFLNTMFALISSSKDTPDKGWLNTFLDTSKHKIIWITNESRLIEESTMRRFSYSLHFPRPNSRNRYQLWKDLLKEHPMRKQIKDETVRRLSSKYPVTTGGIACALSALERVSDIEDSSADTLLTDLVARHAKVIGVQAGNKMQTIPAAYDASILNTDVDLDLVVSSVTKASETAPAYSWGDEYGLNLLLWGAPGTGKTAFVQHIAETTGRELLVKRASDILSPFVGITESKIAEAFEEAADTGSILLLDEADSLLVDRRYAKASWETTQTNELLCQMESYSGMLVCCTNLLEKLDQAVLRRFAWKVEFRELSPPSRRRICERYFPDIEGWEQAAGLSALRGLTPGDVKAVWQRTRTMGEAYDSTCQIVAALAEELRYKTPDTVRIGFQS